LSYLVSDQQQHVLGLRAYQLDPKDQYPVQSILKEDKILNSNYKQVKLGVFSPRFTLLPSNLFDENAAASYINKTSHVKRNDLIMHDTLSDLAIHNIYAFDKHLLQQLEEAFSEVSCYHSSTGLINNFLANFDKTARNIFLNIYHQSVVITVVENNQLSFHNIFSFKASADCLYFVLLVYKQLGFDPKKDALYVVGDLVKDSEIHKLLFKYIRTIKFVEQPNFYTFGKEIKQTLPPHFFFDLYSLKLCE